MFLPNVHAESETEVLLKFIKENPLGILITGINSSSQNFLQCTHVPFVLDLPSTGGNESTAPRLRAHIARCPSDLQRTARSLRDAQLLHRDQA